MTTLSLATLSSNANTSGNGNSAGNSNGGIRGHLFTSAYPSPTTPSFADTFSCSGSNGTTDPLHLFSPYDTMTYYRDEDVFRHANAQMFQLPSFISGEEESPCSAAMAAAALAAYNSSASPSSSSFATSTTTTASAMSTTSGGSPRSSGEETLLSLSGDDATRIKTEGFHLPTVTGDYMGLELAPASVSLSALVPSSSSSSLSSSTNRSSQLQQQKRLYSPSDSDSSLHIAEQRRQVHIQSEQKRRAQIKDGFEELRLELPHCVNKKISKAQILIKTTQYMRQLKNNQFSLVAEIERLRAENERLRKLQGEAVSRCLE